MINYIIIQDILFLFNNFLYCNVYIMPSKSSHKYNYPDEFLTKKKNIEKKFK